MPDYKTRVEQIHKGLSMIGDVPDTITRIMVYSRPRTYTDFLAENMRYDHVQLLINSPHSVDTMSMLIYFTHSYIGL